MNTSTSPWDVVVIGGGPAGMMAAGQAAGLAARVLLLEKNNTLGKKLLITGGGRCNVTNNEPDTRQLLLKFKDSDKFLFSAFSKWSVTDTLNFFHSRNMPTKVEAEARVFPASNSAQSVWQVLIDYLKTTNVEVRSNTHVIGILSKDSTITGIQLASGEQILAKAVILATGGKSRPETGSTGDGFIWLKQLGHTVIEQTSALVPVSIQESWVKRLAGLTLPEVKITSWQNKVKQDGKKGKILFTHVGVSGPTILNMSRDIGELLKYGEVTLTLDLIPSTPEDKLDVELNTLFRTESNKKIKNVLSTIVLSPLVSPLIELAAINPDVFCHSVTRLERLRLTQLLKHLPMQVKGLLGEDKAIVTSGGVDLAEVDFRTMQSRLFPNLYVVGDILNIDRPSGGYSLQLCWTTGAVAGDAAGKLTRSV